MRIFADYGLDKLRLNGIYMWKNVQRNYESRFVKSAVPERGENLIRFFLHDKENNSFISSAALICKQRFFSHLTLTFKFTLKMT